MHGSSLKLLNKILIPQRELKDELFERLNFFILKFNFRCLPICVLKFGFYHDENLEI